MSKYVFTKIKDSDDTLFNQVLNVFKILDKMGEFSLDEIYPQHHLLVSDHDYIYVVMDGKIYQITFLEAKFSDEWKEKYRSNPGYSFLKNISPDEFKKYLKENAEKNDMDDLGGFSYEDYNDFIEKFEDCLPEGKNYLPKDSQEQNEKNKQLESKFNVDKFEKSLPTEMRFKSWDVVDDGVLYWITQEDVYEEAFEAALRRTPFKKGFVIRRDYSSGNYYIDRYKDNGYYYQL